jgi:hypothetical protein
MVNTNTIYYVSLSSINYSVADNLWHLNFSAPNMSLGSGFDINAGHGTKRAWTEYITGRRLQRREPLLRNELSLGRLGGKLRPLMQQVNWVVKH